MKLYGIPPTRAVRPIWLLNELGLDCEIIALNPIDPSDREKLRAVNPSVKVPVLVDEGLTLIESVAIMHFLAERYGKGRFIPSDVEARAQMHQWDLFLVTEIEQPLWRAALHTVIYPEAERNKSEIELAKRDCRKELAQIEAHLNNREFFAGKELSIADFNAAYTLDWADEEGLLQGLPNAQRFVTRMYDRPNAPVRIAEGFAYLRADEIAPRYRRDVMQERRA